MRSTCRSPTSCVIRRLALAQQQMWRKLLTQFRPGTALGHRSSSSSWSSWSLISSFSSSSTRSCLFMWLCHNCPAVCMRAPCALALRRVAWCYKGSCADPSCRPLVSSSHPWRMLFTWTSQTTISDSQLPTLRCSSAHCRCVVPSRCSSAESASARIRNYGLTHDTKAS